MSCHGSDLRIAHMSAKSSKIKSNTSKKQPTSSSGSSTKKLGLLCRNGVFVLLWKKVWHLTLLNEEWTKNEWLHSCFMHNFTRKKPLETWGWCTIKIAFFPSKRTLYEGLFQSCFLNCTFFELRIRFLTTFTTK